MNNYEYIIASLPVLDQDSKARFSADDVVDEIKSQCTEKDIRLIDFLLEGLAGETLDEQFYSRAFSYGNLFLRDYFAYDLAARNAKVRYLNKALGRPAQQDVLCVEDAPEVEGVEAVENALNLQDILARERALDDLVWDRVEALTVLELFSINLILGFIVKLKVIDRWMKLDEQTGREMFRRLVDEVRGTFKGVSYNG